MDGLKALSTLDETTSGQVAALYIEVAGADPDSDVPELVAQSPVVQSLGPLKPRQIVRAVGTLFDAADHFQDPVAAIVDDMVAIGVLPMERRDWVVAFLEELHKQHKERVEPALQRQLAASSVVPSFCRVSTAIDLRAVVPTPFREHSDADAYDPVCTGFVAVVLMSIASHGTPAGRRHDTFVVQLTEDELDELVNVLRATQKDLAAAKAALAQPGGGGDD